MVKNLTALLFFFLQWEYGIARSWMELEIIHGLGTPNPIDILFFTTENNPLGTAMPTMDPATSPPTMQPTEFPTFAPSPRPSFAPSTLKPTSAAPTFRPTDSPTSAPTDPYPFNDPPFFPDPWYYNYDTRDDADYGPGNPGIISTPNGFLAGYQNNFWATVENPPDDQFYWHEFGDEGSGPWSGVLANHMPSRNQCGRIGSQSPVDVRHNGLAECVEHHEVRSLPGDFRLVSNNIAKEIHPNKLRFRYRRRPCGDLTNVQCQEPDPPNADFPNGWGGFADVVHVDFKVPSEHLLNGVRYDAEMQIFHIHKDRRRMPTQATVIRATPDGFNWYFDGALQAFQYEFDRNAIICAASQRRERRRVADFHRDMESMDETDLLYNQTSYGQWGDYSIASENPEFQKRRLEYERFLQSTDGRWDPHHEMLVPSIYFYRYEGSLTEPPCSEWVSWFITDVPMIISLEQLAQLKNILFNHVDHTCRRTSVQFGHSVARPLQETAGRPIYLCTSVDYVADP